MAEMTDQEFEALLADKRHKEMLQVLKKVADAVDRSGENGNLASVLQQNTDAIREFSAAVEKIKENTPNDNPQLGKMCDNLANLANNMKESIGGIKVIAEQKPQQWEFEIKRNPNGFIQSVIAKSKNNA